MITKLAGRIQKLLPLRSPLLYTMSDRRKDDTDPPTRSPFFRSPKSKAESKDLSSNKNQKENPFGAKFFKKSTESKPLNLNTREERVRLRQEPDNLNTFVPEERQFKSNTEKKTTSTLSVFFKEGNLESKLKKKKDVFPFGERE